MVYIRKKKDRPQWMNTASVVAAVFSAIAAVVAAYTSIKNAEYAKDSVKYAKESVEQSQEHNKNAVLPILQIYFNGTEDNKKYGLYLFNAGNGPALVSEITVGKENYSILSGKEMAGLILEYRRKDSEYSKRIIDYLAECPEKETIDSLQALGKLQDLGLHIKTNNVELKNFLLRRNIPLACVNKFIDLDFNVERCYKMSTILPHHTVIKAGEENIILELKHSKIQDSFCRKDIQEFSKWLSNKKIGMKYKSLYQDEYAVKNIPIF